MAREYDVVIVGGGITGAATLYMLATCTNVKRIALVEKERSLAQVNTHRDNNAQTLHIGDIETNYAPDKARRVRDAASLVSRYVEAHPEPGLFARGHKLVLAVGDAEIAALRAHHRRVRRLFPALRLIGAQEIARVEPEVMRGRDPGQRVLALYSDDGYAVDYGALSRSLVARARRSGARIDVLLGERVDRLEREGEGYALRCGTRALRARTLVVAAGAHSLGFAHALGYGREWALLPVAGTFYSSGRKVNGKVYRVDRSGVPFSVPHADPDVADPEVTRYGPLAKVVPMLERGNYASVGEFLRAGELSWPVARALVRVLSQGAYLRYMCRQALYAVPLLGRWMFLREMRKIVPTLRLRDLSRSRRLGGIRPQMLDVKGRRLVMGEAKVMGERAVFDITPSPGASVCLSSARENAIAVVGFLGKGHRFDEAALERELRPAPARAS